MGGCCVVVLMMIMIPVLLCVLLVLLGLLGAGIAGTVVSTALLIIGKTTGLFEKYCNSEVKWQRITAKVIKVLLIIVLVGSVFALIGGIVITKQFFTVR